MTPEAIATLMDDDSIVAQAEASPFGGVSAKFFQINDEWGIKVFHYASEEYCDEVYENQRLLAEHGLAPPVGVKFKVGEQWCYSTRVASPLTKDQWKKFFVETAPYTSQWHKMQKSIKEICPHACDFHRENWGMYEGKVVLIDCGFD